MTTPAATVLLVIRCTMIVRARQTTVLHHCFTVAVAKTPEHVALYARHCCKAIDIGAPARGVALSACDVKMHIVRHHSVVRAGASVCDLLKP